MMRQRTSTTRSSVAPPRPASILPTNPCSQYREEEREMFPTLEVHPFAPRSARTSTDAFSLSALWRRLHPLVSPRPRIPDQAFLRPNDYSRTDGSQLCQVRRPGERRRGGAAAGDQRRVRSPPRSSSNSTDPSRLSRIEKIAKARGYSMAQVRSSLAPSPPRSLTVSRRSPSPGP